jgi:hypothetical protein
MLPGIEIQIVRHPINQLPGSNVPCRRKSTTARYDPSAALLHTEVIAVLSGECSLGMDYWRGIASPSLRKLLHFSPWLQKVIDDFSLPTLIELHGQLVAIGCRHVTVAEFVVEDAGADLVR